MGCCGCTVVTCIIIIVVTHLSLLFNPVACMIRMNTCSDVKYHVDSHSAITCIVAPARSIDIDRFLNP